MYSNNNSINLKIKCQLVKLVFIPSRQVNEAKDSIKYIFILLIERKLVFELDYCFVSRNTQHLRH